LTDANDSALALADDCRNSLRMNPKRTIAIIAALFAAVWIMRADEPQIIPLWTNGAPGFENLRNQPELARDYWVRNINNPSLTVFLPPKEKANGAAIVIVPGGGHRELVFNEEGVKPASYLANLGVAAFALKYRLARETNSPYTIDNAREDAQRAMRLVRSHAKEWNLDPDRIGIVGFSAGGELASLVAFNPTGGNPNAVDPIDRISCRPDFLMEIYPGSLGMPDMVPTNAPPAFFLAAGDDKGPARTIASFLEKYRKAGVPAEVHLFAKGSHAFNMGDRSTLATIKNWPQRLADWLADNNILDPSTPPVGAK
jgi:acetyl esterase/lipase